MATKKKATKKTKVSKKKLGESSDLIKTFQLIREKTIAAYPAEEFNFAAAENGYIEMALGAGFTPEEIAAKFTEAIEDWGSTAAMQRETHSWSQFAFDYLTTGVKPKRIKSGALENDTVKIMAGAILGMWLDGTKLYTNESERSDRSEKRQAFRTNGDLGVAPVFAERAKKRYNGMRDLELADALIFWGQDKPFFDDQDAQYKGIKDLTLSEYRDQQARAHG